jgi:hypothetical protein
VNLKNSRIYIVPAILVGALGPWMVDTIYTSSIVYLCAIVFLSFFLQEYAFVVLGAYVLSDVMRFIKSDELVSILFVIGQLSKYILLYSLVITLPKLASVLSETKSIHLSAYKKYIHAFIGGALVYLWCQAAIILIRPVFVWSYDQDPSVEATESVQRFFYYLIASALVAILARYKYLGESILNESMTKTSRFKFVLIDPFLRMFIFIPFVWLLLAGMYTHWIDGLIAFVAIFAYESGVFENAISPFRLHLKFLEKANAILKFLGGLILSYGVSYFILKISPETQNFRPVLIATLFSLGIFFILFPRHSYYLKK